MVENLPKHTASATNMQGTSPFLMQTPAAYTASGTQIYNTGTSLANELSQVVQTDPSLIGGYRLIYDRMCPMTQWVIDEEMIEKVGHPVNTEESLAVKILIKGADESPDDIKIELLSKKNYFYLYEHSCDSLEYSDIREQQGLHPQYNEYSTMLIRLFNHSITHPETYRCQIQLNKDNSADLFFNQILPFKQLQLLGCHFSLGTEERQHAHNKFRYRVARLQLEQMQDKLALVCRNIKTKNPALLEHVCKEVQKKRPYGQQLDLNAVKAVKKGGPRSNRSRTSGRSRVSISRKSVGSASNFK